MQTRKFGGQQTQLASLRTELDEKAQQVKTLQAAQKRSDQQRHELMSQAEELATQLQARQLPETNATVEAPATPPPASAGEKPNDGKGGLGKMHLQDAARPGHPEVHARPAAIDDGPDVCSAG